VTNNREGSQILVVDHQKKSVLSMIGVPAGKDIGKP